MQHSLADVVPMIACFHPVSQGKFLSLFPVSDTGGSISMFQTFLSDQPSTIYIYLST